MGPLSGQTMSWRFPVQWTPCRVFSQLFRCSCCPTTLPCCEVATWTVPEILPSRSPWSKPRGDQARAILEFSVKLLVKKICVFSTPLARQIFFIALMTQKAMHFNLAFVCDFNPFYMLFNMFIFLNVY